MSNAIPSPTKRSIQVQMSQMFDEGKQNDTGADFLRKETNESKSPSCQKLVDKPSQTGPADSKINISISPIISNVIRFENVEEQIGTASLYDRVTPDTFYIENQEKELREKEMQSQRNRASSMFTLAISHQESAAETERLNYIQKQIYVL